MASELRSEAYAGALVCISTRSCLQMQGNPELVCGAGGAISLHDTGKHLHLFAESCMLCAFTTNGCPMAVCCRRSSERIKQIQEQVIDFRFQDPGSGIFKEHRKYEPGIEAAVEQLYCSMSSHLDYHSDLLVDKHGDISKALSAWWPELQSASQSGEVRPLSWPLLQ